MSLSAINSVLMSLLFAICCLCLPVSDSFSRLSFPVIATSPPMGSRTDLTVAMHRHHLDEQPTGAADHELLLVVLLATHRD